MENIGEYRICSSPICKIVHTSRSARVRLSSHEICSSSPTPHKFLYIQDNVYAMYISDDCPRTIFEIPGAKEVATETASFSKYAGFTGVRLGWTVVPKELLFSDGHPVAKDFNHSVYTCFNGASNIAQVGGLACLSPDGLKVRQVSAGLYWKLIKIGGEAWNEACNLLGM